MAEAVTDKLCGERMQQLEEELRTIEKNMHYRQQQDITSIKEAIRNSCEVNKLELKALKNYIVGFGIAISIVMAIVGLIFRFG